MDLNVRHQVSLGNPEELQQIVNLLKEISQTMVTQEQLDQLKVNLGSKADALIASINTERLQVSEAVQMWKQAVEALQTRIEQLEAQHNLTLDLSDVMGRFDEGIAALPSIYEPEQPPDSAPTAPPPVSEPIAV